ncbi:MAG: DUF3466 family protein [Sedimentisphaerales bacterium]|nr:DUF3466 family protein [Sedimentisphaerales bacterium]
MRDGYTSILVIAAILLTITSSANAYRQVIDLGPGIAYSINDSGQVVGCDYYDQTLPYDYQGNAIFFDSTGSGANINLGTLGGSKSCACSINNHGQIVGKADDSSFYSVACLFDPTGNGVNKKINEYSYGSSSASSINDKGYVVGHTTIEIRNGPYIFNSIHASYFTPPSHPGGSYYACDLGTLGGDESYAYSNNNSGQVVGWAYTTSLGSRFHACLFDTPRGDNNIDLGTLTGDSSIAYSINDYGWIVGQASVTSNSLIYLDHACLFDPTGGGDNTDLGILAGYANSVASFINNNNQIVGWVTSSLSSSPYYNHGQRACLFDPSGNGNNIDLNNLIVPLSGWVLNEARCINNNGWIVGTGTLNGESHAFLLIPEPASALLFALGSFFIVSRCKRR